MITAPVITVSGAPSARVARPCPIDSRSTLPPPKTASSPANPGPPLRSSVISTKRSVSASRMRSPVVGPNSAAYLARETALIGAPTSRKRSSHVQSTRRLQTQAVHLARSAQGDQPDPLGDTGFEPHSGAGGNIQPVAVGCRAVERQRGVALWKMHVAADLNGAITGVDDVHLESLRTLVDLDIALSVDDLTGCPRRALRRHDIVAAENLTATGHQLRDRPSVACAL